MSNINTISYNNSILEKAHTCLKALDIVIEKPFQPVFFYSISENIPIFEKIENPLVDIENPLLYISDFASSPILNKTHIKQAISMNVMENTLVFLGHIQAVFIEDFDENKTFSIFLKNVDIFHTFQVAFKEDIDCLYLRDIENLKEKTIFLRNVMQIQGFFYQRTVIHIHLLNEAVESIKNLHFHMLLLGNNQVFIDFLEEKLKKYEKFLIFQGAVPFSPTRDMLKNEEIQRKTKNFSKFDGNFNVSEDLIISAIPLKNKIFIEKPVFQMKEEEEKGKIAKYPIESKEKLKIFMNIPKKISSIEEEFDIESSISNSSWKSRIKEELINSSRTLLKPYIFLKYGLNSIKCFQPQKRRLSFSSNLSSFEFLKLSKTEGKKVYYLLDVRGVKDGRVTENFRRYKANSDRQMEHSFSIIMRDRSIDLEAQNGNEKKEFCEALKALLYIYKSCK